MSAYNLFLQPMSIFCWYSTCFIVFIPRPVTTGFDWFFCGSGPRFLHSEAFWTGPVCGSSKKGNRTEIGPDFSALLVHQTLVEYKKRKEKKKKYMELEMHLCLELLFIQSPVHCPRVVFVGVTTCQQTMHKHNEQGNSIRQGGKTQTTMQMCLEA